MTDTAPDQRRTSSATIATALNQQAPAAFPGGIHQPWCRPVVSWRFCPTKTSRGTTGLQPGWLTLVLNIHSTCIWCPLLRA